MSAAEVSVAERVLTTDGIGVRPGLATRVRAFTELTKPGITRMVVLTAAAGFYLASAGPLDVALFLHTLVGTALVASAAGALNQWVERDADGRMRRTARRPLPSGRVSITEALIFAGAIASIGLAQLLSFVNATTALIVALSLVSYVFVYTPLKRRTWLATVVGAVPGALPILAGWAGAGTPLDARAWALFGILFLWQMPHFYALAWVYRDDYVRGGFRMLTAFDPSAAELFHTPRGLVEVVDDDIEVRPVLAGLRLGDLLEDQHQALPVRGQCRPLAVAQREEHLDALQLAVEVDQRLGVPGVEDDVGRHSSVLQVVGR